MKQLDNLTPEERAKAERARALIQDVIDHPREHGITCCCLCGSPVHVVGFFDPGKDAKRLGEPEGKTRFIGYGLCDCCFELPNVAELVEQQIFLTHPLAN